MEQFNTQDAVNRIHERIDSIDSRLDNHEQQCAANSAATKIKLNFLLWVSGVGGSAIVAYCVNNIIQSLGV